MTCKFCDNVLTGSSRLVLLVNNSRLISKFFTESLNNVFKISAQAVLSETILFPSRSAILLFEGVLSEKNVLPSSKMFCCRL